MTLMMLLFGFGTLAPPAHAFFTTPASLFCVTPLMGDRPFYLDAASFYQLESSSDADRERVRQIHDISIAYVAPAMKASCDVKKDTGDDFVRAAGTACLKGCTDLIGPHSPGTLDWSIRLTICKADCARGSAFLGGMAWGYAMKKQSR